MKQNYEHQKDLNKSHRVYPATHSTHTRVMYCVGLLRVKCVTIFRVTSTIIKPVVQ